MSRLPIIHRKRPEARAQSRVLFLPLEMSEVMRLMLASRSARFFSSCCTNSISLRTLASLMVAASTNCWCPAFLGHAGDFAPANRRRLPRLRRS